MSLQTLVVSHADADGHLIAEQVRRNLTRVPSFKVSTVVDAERTKDHRTWNRLGALTEIDAADYVFFVDLMFAPASFEQEARALVAFARERPTKQFFVLDHHPLPLRLLGEAKNIHAAYRRDVLDCAFGPRTSMMVVAALCEKQATRAGELQRPIDVELATAMLRAAAPGGPLPGQRLLALLRFDHWDDLVELAHEDATKHRRPRGRRPAADRSSEVLDRLAATADKLLQSKTSAGRKAARTTMPYDLDTELDPSPPKMAIKRADATDLQAIVTLLELAAIYLTPEPGSQFTVGQLVQQAREIGGPDCVVNEADVQVVVGKAGFLRKMAGKKLALK